ncbi:hypothetical protein Tcan_10523 [Toxocara canis]|uniref:Uncharacterized protein n=1 Tax=Toxocara canis TaxID=6265 RepID=A0A0B2V6K6_TOXCA|nr:hypothetical protein Tcan_10523 [Toxocara canis]
MRSFRLMRYPCRQHSQLKISGAPNNDLLLCLAFILASKVDGYGYAGSEPESQFWLSLVGQSV